MTSDFYEKLINGEKPCAVELDPPNKVENYGKFLECIDVLKHAGADIITMADCPSGNPRIDSCIAAAHVFATKEIDVIPHITCRDRNIVALKSQLMGLMASGIRNAILVTGDVIPAERRKDVKGVYQFSSRGFAAFAGSVNHSDLSGEMHFFGALNINANNFSEQLRIAREKIAYGMTGLFTQPVLSKDGFENLKIARNELNCFILGGIIPVVSESNGRFMNDNIKGINIDEKVIGMYKGKEKDECEKLAVDISAEIAARISEYTDGLYFITPFLRTGLMAEILKKVY